MSIALRAAAFQLAFLALHFAYDWWPNGVTAIFSGTDESVFQHMKIGYFAWLAVAVGEWIVRRPRPLAGFVASRLVGAVLMPFVFAAAWYLAAATVGPLPSDPAEIVWANAVILAACVFVLDLEDVLGSRPLPRRFAVAAALMAAAALFMYVRFTREAPWVDLFEVPRVTR